MNELIKNLAAEYKLSFLDLHHIFEKVGNVGLDANNMIKNETNSQTKDGLHPTLKGYQAIGIAACEWLINSNLPHKKNSLFWR